MDAVTRLAPTVGIVAAAISCRWPALPFIGSVLFWVRLHRRRLSQLCQCYCSTMKIVSRTAPRRPYRPPC